MEFRNFTYLILLLGSISVPLSLSFDKKVQYFKNLKYIFPAIFIMAVIFWVWDVRFAKANIWSFNPDFTLGINMIGMPVEEWLFFIVVPYCCVFIYEVLKFYLVKLEYPRPLLGIQSDPRCWICSNQLLFQTSCLYVPDVSILSHLPGVHRF